VKCRFCSFSDDKVIGFARMPRWGGDPPPQGMLECGRLFTTIRAYRRNSLHGHQKDGLPRALRHRQKILQGLLKSCEKRPVQTAKLEALVDEVEASSTKSAGENLSAKTSEGRRNF